MAAGSVAQVADSHLEGPRGNSARPDVERGSPHPYVSIGTGVMLRQVRESRGLSQRELGAKAGTSQAAISKLESQGANPRISTLVRVVEAMGYTLQVVILPPPPTNGSRL